MNIKIIEIVKKTKLRYFAIGLLLLLNVVVLAVDSGELPGDGKMAHMGCPIWNVTYEIGGGGIGFPKVICSTGGSYKCQNMPCPDQK